MEVRENHLFDGLVSCRVVLARQGDVARDEFGYAEIREAALQELVELQLDQQVFVWVIRYQIDKSHYLGRAEPTKVIRELFEENSNDFRPDFGVLGGGEGHKGLESFVWAQIGMLSADQAIEDFHQLSGCVRVGDGGKLDCLVAGDSPSSLKDKVLNGVIKALWEFFLGNLTFAVSLNNLDQRVNLLD